LVGRVRDSFSGIGADLRTRKAKERSSESTAKNQTGISSASTDIWISTKNNPLEGNRTHGSQTLKTPSHPPVKTNPSSTTAIQEIASSDFPTTLSWPLSKSHCRKRLSRPAVYARTGFVGEKEAARMAAGVG
jgi:hypothetical protein